MTLKIGRVALTTPHDVGVTGRRENERRPLPTGRIESNFVAAGRPGYELRGREAGAAAQATMTALEKESRRVGSVYVVESNGLVPEGYYELGAPEYQKPRGAPTNRPWTVNLEPAEFPWIARQAEDDEVAGATTTDTSGDVEEDAYVDYTTTGAYADVLKPSGVAGAEAINLPAGSWRLMARILAVGTATAQARWKTTSLAPADLVTASPVTLTPAGAWTDFDLGAITVAAADHKANWYVLQVQDTVNPGSHVYIDRIWLVPA